MQSEEENINRTHQILAAKILIITVKMGLIGVNLNSFIFAFLVKKATLPMSIVS